MAKKETTNTNPKLESLKKIADVRGKLLGIRLDIKAGTQKNTNAHKKLKKELAQLLTKNNN